ncbi:MAG: flaF [Rhodospirillales bacterium]|jgi:flagellar protein FlaF|nr:flaF [Rhodospirillales bacterium]
MSIAAYRRRQEAAESPRELERRAFRTVIGKLTEGKEKGGRTLIEACFLNNQLWSALAVDLALPDNGLPNELKARLISLALWVQRYTPQVMQGSAPADPLISVNRNILDGLTTMPPSPDRAPAPQVGAA